MAHGIMAFACGIMVFARGAGYLPLVINCL